MVKCAIFMIWATGCCWSAQTESARFDWVLPTGIPDKGRILTQIAAFWFDLLTEPNHLITTDVHQMGLPFGADLPMLAGRSTLCRKTKGVPIECVVRGYLAGSGWKEYQQNGTVCGIRLPAGLVEGARLPEPIFTPSTKADKDTTKTSRSSGWSKIAGRELAEEIAAAERSDFSAWVGIRPAAGYFYRRHEVRVRPDRRRVVVDRRSFDARQFAFLAGQ